MLMFIKNLGKKVKSRKGYTLTELIVVVAILGILAAVATPMVLGQIEKAKVSADDANAKTISNALKVAIVNGDITSSETERSKIISAIEKVLNPIPTPQQKPGYFVLTTSSGAVTFTTTSSSGIVISSNP